MAVTVIRAGVMAGNSRDTGGHPIQVGGSWFVQDSRKPSSTTDPRDGETGSADDGAGRPSHAPALLRRARSDPANAIAAR